jgi:hypothetical protein
MLGSGTWTTSKSIRRSAGSRLQDIAKITLEVDIKPVPLYAGAPSKDEILTFLREAGFSLVSVEQQNHGQEENLTFIRKKDIRRLRDEGPFTPAKADEKS